MKSIKVPKSLTLMPNTLKREEPRLLIGLQARGRHSIGEERERLGRSAFHWSILIHDASTWHRFDVTDGIVQDPVSFENLNPDENWIYRHLQTSSSTDIPRWLGAVHIGNIKSRSEIDHIAALCKNLAVPEKDPTRAQNCLSWAVDAIEAIQRAGLCAPFEIQPMLDFAAHHADGRIMDFYSVPEVVQYPLCTRPLENGVLTRLGHLLRPHVS